MKKNIRHEVIQNIIENNEIATQEELATFLQQLGYETTQATVSRDIKQMGLVKIKGETKKRKYAMPIQNEITEKNHNANIFKASVISIDSSLNMIVIKTEAGSASPAALFIDNLKINEILGTISGDDTILLVAKSVDVVPQIVAKLKGYLK